MTVLMNPDCLDAKHRACSGDGWCEQTDQAVPCPCECHGGPVGAEHFPLCPCGACQNVRAARPDPPVPLAWQPCCGKTLTPTPAPNGWHITNNHHTSCPHWVAFPMPKEGP